MYPQKLYYCTLLYTCVYINVFVSARPVSVLKDSIVLWNEREQMPNLLAPQNEESIDCH